jgi:TPR repeat protein
MPPIASQCGAAYKEGVMSKVLSLKSENPVQPVVHYHVPRTVNPIYPVLLVLVLVVGAASIVAWFCSEFCLENRALRGQAKAEYLLGKRYFDTAVSMQDYARAARLIKQSADQGYAKAQTALGLVYEHGLGVTKSYDQALKWLRRAAEQGYPVAQNELGVMYAKGRGVGRNLDEASKWCRLAATQGSKVAQKNVELTEAAKGRPISPLMKVANQSYANVKLQKIEADGVTVSFSPVHGGFGLAKLKLETLPTQLKELCGYAAKQEKVSESSFSQLSSVATAL